MGKCLMDGGSRLNWDPALPFVLNLHLTKACNMQCVFCFGSFQCTTTQLTQDDWVALIEKLGSELAHLPKKRINFAGGEPLLIPYLSDLIKIAKINGFETSMITNGALLTRSFLERNQGFLDLVGLSIDSLEPHVNELSGRATRLGGMSLEDYLMRCQWVNEFGIPLKINTLIHTHNAALTLVPLLEQVEVKRWKVLRMLVIENENQAYADWAPTDEQFNNFVKRHQAYQPIVEQAADIQQAYCFISPSGALVNNENQIMVETASLLETSFVSAWETLTFNLEGYQKRYINSLS